MHHLGRLVAALRDREPVAAIGAVGAALTWAGGELEEREGGGWTLTVTADMVRALDGNGR